MGSALSPNGLGFADGGGGDMVSLALMDRVLEVDRVSGRARVQVGTRNDVPASKSHLAKVDRVSGNARGRYIRVDLCIREVTCCLK